jgi:hypothetical protein
MDSPEATWIIDFFVTFCGQVVKKTVLSGLNTKVFGIMIMNT